MIKLYILNARYKRIVWSVRYAFILPGTATIQWTLPIYIKVIVTLCVHYRRFTVVAIWWRWRKTEEDDPRSTDIESARQNSFTRKRDGRNTQKQQHTLFLIAVVVSLSCLILWLFIGHSALAYIFYIFSCFCCGCLCCLRVACLFLIPVSRSCVEMCACFSILYFARHFRPLLPSARFS